MSCSDCQATPGWVVIDTQLYGFRVDWEAMQVLQIFNGPIRSGVERCACSIVPPPVTDDRPPTHDLLMKAVVYLAESIPYIAETDEAKEIWAAELARFVSTRHQLNWLVRHAVAKLRRATLAELRALFCTEFRPKDGIIPPPIMDEKGNPDMRFFQPAIEAQLESEYILRSAEEREHRFAELGPARQNDLILELRRIAAAKGM